jgi:hypothetical protein
LLAASAGLLVLYLVLNGSLEHWSQTRSQRLYTAGTPTGGTVVDIGNDGQGFLIASRVVFTYQVPGEPNPRRASLRQRSSGGRDYHRGERVSVVYDPTDPARAAIVGESNQPLLVGLAVQLPFTLGFGVLGLGIPYWRRGRRLRKGLARAGWRPWRYRHIALPGRTSQRTRHILTLEPELAGPWQPLLREVSPYGPASNQAWQRTGTAWVADDPRTPRRLIVALPGEAVMALYRASRPRPDLTDSRDDSTIGCSRA